ncbi:phosphatase PAP2 family protein [Proteiniclasticum sediminis]|uniref:phosphatase PAP2 family protein n=1 Tax=Proteiniclasticum sediminis TaxID=2804028 RepID=UPI002ED841D3
MINLLETLQQWDENIVIYINKNFKHKLLDYFFIAVTYLGSDVFALGFVLAFSFLPGRNLDDFSISAAIGLILSSLTVGILKNTIRRKRPFQTIIELESLKIGVDQYSFPSGHTSAAFCLAVTTAMVTSGHISSALYMALAFLVAISRVYLGVHYPTDVTAGALIGSFSAALVHILRR